MAKVIINGQELDQDFTLHDKEEKPVPLDDGHRIEISIDVKDITQPTKDFLVSVGFKF